MASFTNTTNTKAALDITSNNDDTRITNLIPQVGSLVERLMDRLGVFFQNGSDVDEYPVVRSSGSSRLFLARYPNAAITNLWVSEDVPRVYDATTLLTADEDYIVEPELGIVHRLGSLSWPTDVRAIKVEYDGGYTADAGGGPGGAAPFPAELERAVQMIIAAMLQKGKDRGYHLTGHEVGDGAVKGIRFDDVPDTAREILEAYRDTRQEF